MSVAVFVTVVLVFVSCVCVRVIRRNRRSHRCCRRHRHRIRRHCVQPTARYQQRGEDVLVAVTFVALRESLGLINCFVSLLLANPW